MQKQAKDHFSSAASNPPEPGVCDCEIVLKKWNKGKKRNPTTDECGKPRWRPKASHQFMFIAGTTSSERCHLKLACIYKWTAVLMLPFAGCYISTSGGSMCNFPFSIIPQPHSRWQIQVRRSLASLFALSAGKAWFPATAATLLCYTALWPADSSC